MLVVLRWQDLISGDKFKRKDIIILQDPLDYSNREIENFEHLRRAKAGESVSRRSFSVACAW